jgi:hypothetical protein
MPASECTSMPLLGVQPEAVELITSTDTQVWRQDDTRQTADGRSGPRLTLRHWPSVHDF